MASAQYNDLRVKAERWQQEVRRRLEEMNGVGDRRAFAAGTPFGNPNTKHLNEKLFPGSLNLQYGARPNDQELAKFIEMIGGNPYMKQINAGASKKASKGSSSRSIQKAATSALSAAFPGLRPYFEQPRGKQKSTLQEFLDEAQSKYDEANEANEQRYQDILGQLEGIRERNLERVENFNKAAGQDLEQRSRENLGRIRANLSARGLGNSTIFDAFRQRAATDLAREQQRLSEQTDSRLAEYDSNLTSQLAQFMERRNDVAPDFAQIAQIAQQYGLANDGNGYDTQAASPGAYVPAQPAGPSVHRTISAPERDEHTSALPTYAPAPVAGVSANTARRIQSGFSFDGMFGGAPTIGWGAPRGSNRYPQRRSPAHYQAVRAKKGPHLNQPEDAPPPAAAPQDLESYYDSLFNQ